MFRFGFEELKTAYRTSMASYDAAMTNAEAVVRSRYGFGPDEPFPDVEYDDEDGTPSMEWRVMVGELEHEAQSSQSLVRTAFVSALFHFWERQSNAWRGVRGDTYKHAATMGWLEAQGVQPHGETIRTLELTAHCSKHGAGKACTALHQRRPDLFDLEETGPQAVPSDHNLLITADLADSFFEAVFRSGPPMRTPWS